MTFTAHCLVEFTGSWLYTDAPNESWMFGVRLSKTAPDWGGLDDPADYIATVGPSLKSWFQSSSNNMASKAALGLIKCNNIDVNGHYADPVTHSYDAGGAVGGVTDSMPISTSLVITWGTGRSSGRARHGRIYPPTAIIAMATGMGASITTTTAAQQVATGKALLTALHVASPLNSVAPTPVVCSKIDGSIHPITSVSCDTRLDIQRRRTRQVAGVKSSAAWP